MTSAQRLSASSEFSLRNPFLDILRVCPVLNAFRHHRNSHPPISSCHERTRMCSTPFGIIGILTSACSANIREVNCAQRLSASSEFSRQRPASLCGQQSVLNAFRHHRNSHLPSLYHHASLSVLNAFRHHRNSHSRSKTDFLPVLQCSTPFGIIGILTSDR